MVLHQAGIEYIEKRYGPTPNPYSGKDWLADEKSLNLPFSICGLPYWIEGTTKLVQVNAKRISIIRFRSEGSTDYKPL